MTELTNFERIRMLGETLYRPGYWKKSLQRDTGISRNTIAVWLRDRREDVSDQQVNRVLAVAKRKRDALDRVIKRVTLYPWIT